MTERIKAKDIIITIAVIVVFAIALVLARTRIPFAHGLEYMFWVAYMFPALASTIGWIMMLDPDTGFLNQAVRLLPFVDHAPFNIYSVPGIVWAKLMGDGIAFKVMLLTPAFRNMDAPLEEARDYLRELPGVGRKTAACVLLFSYGRPDIPVDTHVFRVGSRLGLFRPGASFNEAHDEMLRLVADDPEEAYEVHVGLIRHGRRICTAREPRCGECPLLRLCPYGKARRRSGQA